MSGNLKKGWRRVKGTAHNRSSSSANQQPDASPTIKDAIPHTLGALQTPLSMPVADPSAVVLPAAQPHSCVHNPGQGAATSAAPQTRDQSTRHTKWAGLKSLLGVLGEGSGAFGPLKTAATGLSQCVETFEQRSRNNEDYEKLRNELNVLLEDLSRYLGGSAPPTMTPIIENIAKSIEREIDILLQTECKNGLGRFVKAMEDADELLECYRRIQALLGRLILNANMSLWKHIDEQTMELRLSKLPNAPTAMYRSTVSDNLRRVGCTPNTRVDVIEQLRSWAGDNTDEKVYWLNGMAGTGKTTIAYTLCDYLQNDSRLGASFFCSRQLPECRDVNRILPSISYQLSLFSIPFRYALSGMLEQYRDIYNQPLEDQFKYLVSMPLQEVAHTFAMGVILVIDAIDECEDKDGVARVLGVLLSYASDLDVKFFVTSRPDPKILDQMRSQADRARRSELRLHELDLAIVQQDITTYLRAKLRRANISYEQITQLAQRSGVLFIYAATVVRYIEYDNFSRSSQRLRLVLGASATTLNGSDRDVDMLYTAILKAAFDDRGLEDFEKEEMRDILCHVICAQEPLSVVIIAGLLGQDDIYSVQAALRPLLSVLNLSETSGIVTTLHESFPNYLLNRNRSGNFHCDASRHHAQLAKLCFNQIKAPNPPFNVCQLQSSYVCENHVYPSIEERICKALSKSLMYACRYWGAHIQLATMAVELDNELYELLSVRLLLWMEVLNLKKRMHEGAEMLYKIHMWCKGKDCSEDLQLLVQDAYRFVAVVSSSPILRSTPHIYVSALAFWPKSRPVSRCYLPKMSGLVNLTGTAMARQELTPVAIRTHASVKCVAYSSDGKNIASGHTDGSIWIWDARTGHSVRQPLKYHTSMILMVSYCSDGTYLVSGDSTGMICMWDTRTHEMVEGPPMDNTYCGVISAVCSPDGIHISSCTYNDTVCIWNRYTGQIVGRLPEEDNSWVKAVAYSPDGAYITTSSPFNNTIQIWDPLTCQMIGKPLAGHTATVNAVAYSPNGVFIVSGSQDKTIRIWSSETGQAIGQPLEGHTEGVNSVQYSPSGVHIVSGSYDSTVRIWDAINQQMIRRLDGHTGSVHSARYSPNGSYIVSCSEDQTVYIWDAPSYPSAVRQNLHHTCDSKPAARTISAVQLDSSLDETGGIQDPSTGQPGVGRPPEGHTGLINSVSYSPDGTYILSGSSDQTVCVWDAQTGKLIGQMSEDNRESFQTVSYSSDGLRIIASGPGRSIRIWDAQTGKTIGQPFCNYGGWVGSTSYSRDDICIASGYEDIFIWIWDDVPTGEVVGQLLRTGHAGPVRSVSVSLDGACLVSGSQDWTLRIWNAHTRQLIGRPLKGHTGAVTSVTFSPDGAYVASGSADKTLRIWDAHTGRMIGDPLRGHTKSVTSISYSPDGAYIASGSRDGSIRVWNVRTGQIVGLPFSCFGSTVCSVAFSPDGTQIVSGHSDGSIRVWHIYTRQIISALAQSTTGFRPQSIKPCPCNVCNSFAGWDTWELDKDGWIVNECFGLMSWVPPGLRSSIVYPHNTILISRHGSLELDFRNANLGKDWRRCYSP
ncbi:hypothetical protein FRC12_023669 [Ceratobasidium sp. 428]|nr:hypothetical protein FRC12_023669 [Ceratobasidium sp. 428]